MAELFYRLERDSEFFKICESVRSEIGLSMPIADVVSIAILRPAGSFFLHPQEYSNIIRNNGSRLPKNEIKRELHLEILRRYAEIKSHDPEIKAHEAAKVLDSHPAPRFYLSERRAIDLYYELLKNQPK